MSYPPQPRADRAYRTKAKALKRIVKAKALPCWICGRPIDVDLPWKDPMSFTADHKKALANGGHLLGELLPAHRACNSRRGARETVSSVAPPATSRRW